MKNRILSFNVLHTASKTNTFQYENVTLVLIHTTGKNLTFYNTFLQNPFLI